MSTTTTITRDDQTATPAADSVRRRRSAPHGRVAAETPTRASDDGKSTFVALHGTYGGGRWMCVDSDKWPALAAQHGHGWILNANGDRGRYHVRRGGKALAAAARQPGARPTAALARLIMNAPRGYVVLYRDGDTLNLRCANLELVTRAEANRRNLAGPRRQ